MEMEPSPPVVAKKLWNIVRIMFLMMRKGISNSKSKLIVDLQVLFQRGKLAAAGKAIGDLITSHHYHHSSLSCRSGDAAMSFISPKEYEFSCSNSPAYFHVSKRKHHRQHLHHLAKASRYDDAATINAVQKVLEMLNNEKVDASPMTYLPGFGRSPVGRQLRITDSPFPLKDTDEDGQVDKAAEEFIKNFYKDLKSQKNKSVLESPYHEMWGR